MTAKLLIVDDDRTLLRFMEDYLLGDGFEVETAASGKEALRIFYEARPDLVVLDVMMPGMDGWEVCARIREMSQVPIIFLTAKASEKDKLRGFRLGVDDYVTKPFSLAELAARTKAVLARTETEREQLQSVIQVGSLAVDMGRHEVTLGNQPVSLTETEFRLLAALTTQAGKAVSKEKLIQEVWGGNVEKSGSVLRRYIWFLRKKIEEKPANPKRIVTVRGYGYRLEN